MLHLLISPWYWQFHTVLVPLIFWRFKKGKKSWERGCSVAVKPISSNRGLNLANPGLKFLLRLDSVPESTINTNQVINEGLKFNPPSEVD